MRTRKKNNLLAWGMMICLATWMMVSCGSIPENPTVVEQLPPIFPDYAGVTIPAEIGWCVAKKVASCMSMASMPTSILTNGIG